VRIDVGQKVSFDPDRFVDFCLHDRPGGFARIRRRLIDMSRGRLAPNCYLEIDLGMLCAGIDSPSPRRSPSVGKNPIERGIGLLPVQETDPSPDSSVISRICLIPLNVS